jgi:hypothetical protein
LEAEDVAVAVGWAEPALEDVPPETVKGDVSNNGVGRKNNVIKLGA